MRLAVKNERGKFREMRKLRCMKRRLDCRIHYNS